MIVDNFERIKKFIKLENQKRFVNSEDDDNQFYLLQIIHRSKDGLTKFDEEGEKSHFSNKTIKSYYISSPEYLDKKEKEIMEMCHMFNARAYFNPNVKSYKQIALKSLSELAKMVSNESYKGILSLVDSSCGQCGSAVKGQNYWIVDIDTKDIDELNKIKSVIDKCEPIGEEKVVQIIPTLHGYHFISKPFNKKKFHDMYSEQIDIHDNNPTLLYYKEPDNQ